MLSPATVRSSWTQEDVVEVAGEGHESRARLLGRYPRSACCGRASKVSRKNRLASSMVMTGLDWIGTIICYLRRAYHLLLTLFFLRH